MYYKLGWTIAWLRHPDAALKVRKHATWYRFSRIQSGASLEEYYFLRKIFYEADTIFSKKKF